MGADERAFFDDGDLDIADRRAVFDALFDKLVVLFDLGLKVQSGGQVGRPGPDENHIHLDLFAFYHIFNFVNEWLFS